MINLNFPQCSRSPLLHGLGKERDISLGRKAEKKEIPAIGGRGELDKQSEMVLYGRGVAREEAEQYKQIEVILSVCIWTGLQTEVTWDKVV